MIKIVFVLLALFILHSDLNAQKKLAKKKSDYDTGSIMLPDSTIVPGLIRRRTQSGRGDIWFRETESGDAKRYRPSTLIGYKRDTTIFRSIFKIPVYSWFASLGKTSEEPELFGEVRADGKIKVYLVITYGSDAITNTNIFLHYIFQKDSAGTTVSQSLPVSAPVTNKRYLKITADLEFFFEGYPKIQAYLRKWKIPAEIDDEQYKVLIDMIKAEG